MGSSRRDAYWGILSEHKEPSPVFICHYLSVLSEHKVPSPVFLENYTDSKTRIASFSNGRLASKQKPSIAIGIEAEISNAFIIP